MLSEVLTHVNRFCKKILEKIRKIFRQSKEVIKTKMPGTSAPGIEGGKKSKWVLPLAELFAVLTENLISYCPTKNSTSNKCQKIIPAHYFHLQLYSTISVNQVL